MNRPVRPIIIITIITIITLIIIIIIVILSQIKTRIVKTPTAIIKSKSHMAVVIIKIDGGIVVKILRPCPQRPRRHLVHPHQRPRLRPLRRLRPPDLHLGPRHLDPHHVPTHLVVHDRSSRIPPIGVDVAVIVAIVAQVTRTLKNLGLVLERICQALVVRLTTTPTRVVLMTEIITPTIVMETVAKRISDENVRRPHRQTAPCPRIRRRLLRPSPNHLLFVRLLSHLVETQTKRARLTVYQKPPSLRLRHIGQKMATNSLDLSNRSIISRIILLETRKTR